MRSKIKRYCGQCTNVKHKRNFEIKYNIYWVCIASTLEKHYREISVYHMIDSMIIYPQPLVSVFFYTLACRIRMGNLHYLAVNMGAMASQITIRTIV